MKEILAAFDGVSVHDGSRVLLDRVSFSVSEGDAYALLGREDESRAAVADCLLGKRKPFSGKVLVFGRDPRKRRWGRHRRIASVSGDPGEKSLGAAIAHGADLLVLHDVHPLPGKSDLALSEKAISVFLIAKEAAGIEAIADRVGFLKSGRLRFEQDTASLASDVRRIRYRNEVTESRTDYGSELDEFEAVRVRARGWGIEAVVRDYTPDKFERFRSREGIVDASAAPVSLEELFSAVAGPVAEAPSM